MEPYNRTQHRCTVCWYYRDLRGTKWFCHCLIEINATIPAMFHMRQITILLLVLVVACGCRPVVQVVAWAGMLWSNTQESSFDQAIADTFSGDQPCKLCKAIVAQQEKKTNTSVIEPQLRLNSYLFSPSVTDIPEKSTAFVGVKFAYCDEMPLVGWQTSPPTPPPRV